MKSSACGDVSMSGDDDIELEKSNILLIGPTGSGDANTYVVHLYCENAVCLSRSFAMNLWQVKHC